MIEAQINYIAETLLYMQDHNVKVVDVKQNVHDEYNRNLQKKFSLDNELLKLLFKSKRKRKESLIDFEILF